MKDYKEITESVFRKSEERIAAKEHRAALIRRTVFAVSGICAAFIVAFGVLTNDSIRNGKENDFNGNNLVTESSQTDVIENERATSTLPDQTDRTDTETSVNATTASSSVAVNSTTSNTSFSTTKTASTAQSSQGTNSVQTTAVTATQEINGSATTAINVTTSALEGVIQPVTTMMTTVACAETTSPAVPEEAVTTRVTSTVTMIATTTTVTYATSSELSPLIPWSEQTLCQIFGKFKLEDVDESVGIMTKQRVYTSNSLTIAPEEIGEFVTSMEFTGTETTKDGTKIEHKINGNIYTVKDLSEYAVLAVQFEGDSVYYHYYNSWYKPNTLGDMIKDLNISSDIISETVFLTDYSESYQSRKFTGVDGDVIWNMIMYDTSLSNVYDYTHSTGLTLVRKIGFSVNIEHLGRTNISLGLTEEGYILTNIVHMGAAFYVGEDKTQEVIDFVVNNYTEVT